MNVLVWGGEASRKAARDHLHEVAQSKEDLFARADIVTIHLRLVDETRSIVKLALLQSMKPSALFVNTSRAELVETDALMKALNGGRPGLAAIDVFEQEPPLAGQPLLRMENVVCTPHLGYVEKASYELYFSAAFQNIVAYASGAPMNVVNPETLPG
jgi:D-3-phosphoglycerate dehydrogenase